ncbi:MAG: PAS domain-containing sensor histidine kinase [Gammaproteobacteria bacterium]|nr:PAS domain-containing sensor histidine kinase [Gammaproteobacteria bacterium]
MERTWLPRLWRRHRPSGRWPGDPLNDIDALFESSQSGMALLEGDRILRVNPAFAQLLGISVEDLRDSSFRPLLPPSMKFDPDRFARGDTLEGEVQLAASDGLRDVSLRVRRLAADHGRPLLIISAEDITDLRRSEQALRDHARRLRVLSRQVIDVQEQERRHLARELHDEIGQQLTMIRLGLERLQESVTSEAARSHLATTVGQVAVLTEQVRSLSLDLRPSMLDDLGLVAALRWYATRTARLAGLSLQLDLAEDFPRLEPDIETALFRIAQEAMNNSLKYAQASRLELGLRLERDSVRMDIADDGQGFDPAQRPSATGTGTGLLGMEERASLVGAYFEIRSAPGQGCRIQLSLPMPLRQS